MDYICTPISYIDDTLVLTRQTKDVVNMLDNFIELVVFTPRGGFSADPDFGFEYWNHEYANVDSSAFNSGQNGSYVSGINNEITKRKCQDSIKQSLEIYESVLKQVAVEIEISTIEDSSDTNNTYRSKRNIKVVVTGILNDGLGTFQPYRKEVCFFMEPTIKHTR